MKYIAIMGYTNNYSEAIKAIESVKPFWDNLVIIDNSIGKDIFNNFSLTVNSKIKVVSTHCNLNCSQMFNMMQEIARDIDVDVLISMHSDILVSDGACEYLLNYIENLKYYENSYDKNWGVVLTMHDALAAWNLDAVDIIGPWDERIDQYPTDADYLRRLGLFGFGRLVTLYEGQIQHNASSTIRKNYYMQYLNQKFIVNKNREYYNLKWGNDSYKIPFNGEDIDFVYNKLIDTDIYKQLFDTFQTTEGAFLQETDRNTRIAQFTFVTNIIKAIKPKRILETGTHKGFFTYFLSNILEKFEIFTFDKNPNCQKSIDILKNNLNNIKINFKAGNTIKTLSEFKINSIDFAFIDGGHNYNPALFDIKNCIRLGIKNILIDDYKVPTVKQAVDKILEENENYYVIENPLNYLDCRGMILLRKKRD